MSTPYHARYFAYELTRQHGPGQPDRLSMALFDACVDLNPHQIDAAAFASRNPLSKGVLLADEVGLGKTIEAGLVLCQLWAEHKRRLLVICPASLRKQWSLELYEKFNLPSVILDSTTYGQAQRRGEANPFEVGKVVVTSLNFAAKMRADIRAVPFDLVVIDEAHKLRNAYLSTNKTGRNIKFGIDERRKILLTATPLQNKLLELFGLATVLDDTIFGDVNAFKSQYAGNADGNEALRSRLQHFCQRTLRRQVNEYIKYTERKAMTVRFRPTEDEQKLYQAVSEYLMRDNTLAIPKKHRHLTTLVVRKLLASSSRAVANTLETMKNRLVQIRDGLEASDHLAEDLIEYEDIEQDLLDELIDEDEAPQSSSEAPSRESYDAEIEELSRFAQWARNIEIDTKTRKLQEALATGFSQMEKMGAKRKALIFTESRRTQEYLRKYLEKNGYAGQTDTGFWASQVVLFSGTNSDPDSRQIIDKWIADNAEAGRVSDSRSVNSRTALVEHFRDHASVMIATEAAAEGVNLQFCSLVINYDLPWNPQRIEQRIGRCHRYGQKHDVVVINFLNERNEADRRVHELLENKFNLFSGVFGASDEVLGSIESGVDFENRVLAIYQQCRTTEEIDTAFRTLQQEMEESIKSRLDNTRKVLLEQFDEDVHARLKIQLDNAQANMGRIRRIFWTLTRLILADRATFDDDALTFDLHQPPRDGITPGHYHLISKTQENVPGEFLYRLSHLLGEWVLDTGKNCSTPPAVVTFDVTNYPAKLSVVEVLKGQSGWLALQHLAINSCDRRDHLLFSAFTDAGKSLDQETCERLFLCSASVEPLEGVPDEASSRLMVETNLHADAAIASSHAENERFYAEEQERLEKWAEDKQSAAEKDVNETRTQLKALRRQSGLVKTLDERNDIETRIRNLGKKERRQREQIFAILDEIDDKRDLLLAGIQAKLKQTTANTPLFTIRWRVI